MCVCVREQYIGINDTSSFKGFTYSFGAFEVESVVGDQHFAFDGTVEGTDVNDVFIWNQENTRFICLCLTRTVSQSVLV